ncbi:MAG: hypothetical protein LUE15_00585, partial [Oscillospiraceae bacterium]|nr:hypothetical protein [Oscillospiraceae bacterium]
AMLIIITSHIVQTISTGNGYIEQNFDVLDLNAASSNMQYLALSVMRMGGGSIIFFVCSAWFLLDSKRVRQAQPLSWSATAGTALSLL